jgi:hypothetical protein
MNYWQNKISLLCRIVWTMLGILVISGAFLNPFYFMMNIIVGLAIVAISLLFQYRAFQLKCFYNSLNKDAKNNAHLKTFVKVDIMINLGVLLISIVLLSGAVSRVFFERMSIFG